MLRLSFLLFATISYVVTQNVSPSPFLTTVDKDRLKHVFESSFNNNSNDLKTAHYALLGYSVFGEKFPHEKEACAVFKKVAESANLDLEALYHLASGAGLLGIDRCKVNKDKAAQIVQEQIDGNSPSTETLYKSLMILKNLKLKVDSKKFKKLIDEALKKDSSAPVYAYVLHMIAELDLEKTQLKPYFDEIKDVVLQADEADGTYLYYENGLFTTAFIVDGIFKLASKVGEAPKISDTVARKFANFLLSRRHSYQLRAAAYLTSALRTLGLNNVQVPVGISIEGPSAVNSENPHLMLKLCNVWGDPLSDFTIVANSAKNTKSGGTFLTDTPFQASTGQKGLYTLDLMKAKPTTGFYTVKLTVSPTSNKVKKFVGLDKLEVEAKVTSAVTSKNTIITVKEKEQGSNVESVKLNWGDRHPSTIRMDAHHYLDLTFQLVSSTADIVVSVHQTFVKLTHVTTKQEIIFVAEADRENVYKFSLDLSSKAKEFDYLSGDYTMDLIIGDALIDNPTLWNMATLDLVMPEPGAASAKSDQTAAGAKRSTPTGRAARVGTGPTQAKPEIFHKFKEPEQRAGKTVAYVFSFLVTIPPALIMLVLWMKIGVNTSNFFGSGILWSVGFHASLLLIFGLYYCYWTHLNMFTTLFYLGLLSIPTFLCGWQVLAHLAILREKKSV